jgi:hypothetical protein
MRRGWHTNAMRVTRELFMWETYFQDLGNDHKDYVNIEYGR